MPDIRYLQTDFDSDYLRRNQNDIGGGMGKDYMKEHWGIDDDK